MRAHRSVPNPREKPGAGARASCAPGTPEWWAAHLVESVPAKLGPGRTPRRPNDLIGVAAQLLDELGANGVTMRLLADRLGTSTSTLYRHFSGKEELLVRVCDHLLGEVQLSVAGNFHEWKDPMRDLAEQCRMLFARHPEILPLLVSQLPVGPNMLEIRERGLAALAQFAFSPRLAARTFTTVLWYAVGYAVTQPEAPHLDRTLAVRDYYRSLDRHAYPNVVGAADMLARTAPADEFRAGMELVLDGIGCEFKRERERGLSTAESIRIQAQDPQDG
jgi:AcrR family transcriptional regulator